MKIRSSYSFHISGKFSKHVLRRPVVHDGINGSVDGNVLDAVVFSGNAVVHAITFGAGKMMYQS